MFNKIIILLKESRFIAWEFVCLTENLYLKKPKYILLVCFEVLILQQVLIWIDNTANAQQLNKENSIVFAW